MDQDTLLLTAPFGFARLARPDDAPKIVQMAHGLATFHDDTPSLDLDALNRDVFGDIPWFHIIVAQRDSDLLGYAALFGCGQLQFGARGMDLHHLFADPTARGQGVGTHLVRACMIFARGLSCQYMSVGTHPDNHAAQRFYQGFGFERREAHPPRFSIRLDGGADGQAS